MLEKQKQELEQILRIRDRDVIIDCSGIRQTIAHTLENTTHSAPARTCSLGTVTLNENPDWAKLEVVIQTWEREDIGDKCDEAAGDLVTTVRITKSVGSHSQGKDDAPLLACKILSF